MTEREGGEKGWRGGDTVYPVFQLLQFPVSDNKEKNL